MTQQDFDKLEKELRLRYISPGRKFDIIETDATAYSTPCLRAVIIDELTEYMDMTVYRSRKNNGEYWVTISCCDRILTKDTINIK